MKKPYLTTLWLCMLPLLNSCSDDDSSGGNGMQTGQVVLSLKTGGEYNGIEIVGATRSGSGTLELNAEDFKIQLINSQGTVSKQWERYGDMPDKVRLNAGSYTMRAAYGSATAAGFDAPYFLGEEPFTLEGQQTRQIEVTCMLANSKVAVEFGGQLRQDYTDFRAEISSAGSPAVTFSKDERRAAYLPAGDLQIKIYLTDENGTRSYAPDPVKAAARDFITLKIDSKDASGNLTLNISTVTDTEQKEIDVELPAFMLPKAAPTMNYDGFDAATGSLATTEGVQPAAAQVNLCADGGIRHCRVSVSSEELSARGWPTEFDLADGTLSAETAELLLASGLVWTEQMRDALLARIDFSGLARQLTASGETPRSSRFTIRLTDAFGQTSPEQTITLTANAPRFTLHPIATGNVWASKVDLGIEVAQGNPDIPVLQYKTASTEWADCPVTDRRIDGANVAMTARPLSPGTEYRFRVKYNDHYYLYEPSVTTEAATQIPNSDFETYCEYKYNSGNDINQYFWYASQQTSDKWWATRNPASASQLTGSWMGGKNDYTRNNGTTPVDHAGGKAVEMKTTAWGRGNTSTINGGGTKYNITAAVLFVGDYAYTLDESGGSTLPGKGIMTSETITQGHAFASRPARIGFQYKYAPLNGESFEAYAVVQNRDNGTVELARASVPASVASQRVDEMQDLSLDFVYDPQHMHLKATHICIFFASCNKMEWKEGTNRPATTNSGTGSMHYGSTLVIDNLTLDYTF